MSELVFSIGFYDDDYIFMPACCYNGNRFRVLKKKYPPAFTVDEARLDMPATMTDVPRLNIDGSGAIEVTTGDVAVPCIGVYSPSRRHAWLLFTVQEINGKNLGLAYEGGKMIITYPARRALVYTMATLTPNTVEYKSEDAEIPYRMLDFECYSMEEFYKFFFENRKIMGMDDTVPATIPKEEQLKKHFAKFNSYNWREEGEFYSCSNVREKPIIWEPGWCGGAMHTYAFLKFGGELERERSMKTLSHLIEYQGKSGLFIGMHDRELRQGGDGFGNPGTQKWTLIRRSADCLYYVIRQFELMETVPDWLENGMRKCADAFVKLWRTYGQLGQFVDVDTGEIAVGGSASGAVASAGLVVAYRYYADPEYLAVAKEIAEYYYGNFIKKGYTTGGPGEILSAPDSESAFGLLESLVWLYDETRVKKFLDYAVATAHQCSSWVVPYNYKFPKNSEFARLDMKTVGTVFANVQNKHSAPGICTHSGTSLRKLYEWTGDKRFLDLYLEIGETIAQYMSTDERPIMCEDRKIPAPDGFICERVNMSDWEEENWVGSIFFGGCWCETSNLLYIAEV